MSSPHATPARRPPIAVGHAPVRPIWVCRRGCGTWPCPSARLTLRAAYDDDLVGLAVEMAGYLFDATGDLVRLNPDDMPGPEALFTRFVGWTRRTPFT
ncbi:hypothetical protein [Micromonospora lupini]|uniref:Uncharacterized protein n=1 Tax=Micromonospora lupini str. Lupac 08 TaxID=1150864 RepID=I0KWV1_9ACTN|nr:hypothetical protein [Micromonospora lupini]CCH16048.1 Conserved hypothetical protein [Micromonospora lupini str. Lupac 08]